MFEPTEFEVDDDIRRSMDLFERAKVGEVAPVEPRRPTRLLLVLDASAQDATSVAVAEGLQRRFGCPVAVMDGREAVESNELVESVHLGTDVQRVPKLRGDSYEQVLTGVEQTGCDVVIVPCPFGRDLEKVGADSTGTVIDVLLARCPVPLLVIRHAFSDDSQPFRQVRMVLLGENEAASAAAAWAAGLVVSGGRLNLALILTKEAFENVRQLMQTIAPDAEITPDSLADSLARSQFRLHRALQKASAEVGFKYRLDVLTEDQGSLDQNTGSGAGELLVLPLERGDHRSQGYVHHRIRQAADPLLVVPLVPS